MGPVSRTWAQTSSPWRHIHAASAPGGATCGRGLKILAEGCYLAARKQLLSLTPGVLRPRRKAATSRFLSPEPDDDTTSVPDARTGWSTGKEGEICRHQLEVTENERLPTMPVFGMNFGTTCFLMNSYAEEELPERLAGARPLNIAPRSALSQHRQNSADKWE